MYWSILPGTFLSPYQMFLTLKSGVDVFIVFSQLPKSKHHSSQGLELLGASDCLRLAPIWRSKRKFASQMWENGSQCKALNYPSSHLKLRWSFHRVDWQRHRKINPHYILRAHYHLWKHVMWCFTKLQLYMTTSSSMLDNHNLLQPTCKTIFWIFEAFNPAGWARIAQWWLVQQNCMSGWVLGKVYS